MVVVRAAALGALCAIALGCNWKQFEAPSIPPPACVTPDGHDGATVSMTFAPSADFFAAPFPAMGRPSSNIAAGAPDTGADGSSFPVILPLPYRLRGMLPTNGYALTAAMFFELSNGVDPSKLPPFPPAAPQGSPSVLVFPLDDPSAFAPVRVGQTRLPEGTTAPAGHTMLAILPVQGRPLRENTDYAAIVTTQIGTRDASGTMEALCTAFDQHSSADLPQVGLRQPVVGKYLTAIGSAVLQTGGCSDIAAMSVFHTGDPTATMRAATDLARAHYRRDQGTCTVPMQRDRPGGSTRCPKAPYCVFTGTANMPQYQRGDPPYLPFVQWGGGWPSSTVPPPPAGPAGCDPKVGSRSAPDATSWEPTYRNARVVVTIPHTPPPPSGYPIIVYVRAGAGTMTDPLVDRGPTLAPGCNNTDCRGPGEVFQSAGFAGITIDGPLTGESRLEPGWDNNEDFSIYNFLNPLALRDNLRQSALELTLVPDIIRQLSIALEDCEGADAAGPGQAKFDLDHLAMFSHSMGSSIAPMALAVDPRYRLSILSGSGGSLIENVVYKANPVPIYVAGELLDLPQGCELDEYLPALSLLQWATESSDSQLYARRMITDSAPPGAGWWAPNARDVLMIQGLVDHDILPPIADVMTLGEGLDLGLGPNSCSGNPRCDVMPVYGEVAAPGFPSLPELLPLSGGHYGPLTAMTGNRAWPASVPRPPNTAGDLTALVVQHRIDENREALGQACDVNGHEVIYESTLARHQYACFLSDFARDRTPSVRLAGEEFAPCDP
jgi:hypothetical protein